MYHRSRLVLNLILIVSLILSSFYFPNNLVAAEDELDESISSFNIPEKGNPKLDSFLNQLISSEIPLQIYGFAQPESDTESETVRVVVECLPDMIESVRQAIEQFANIETTYGNWIQILTIKSNLVSLTEIGGVSFIRLPYDIYESIISEGVDLIGGDHWQTSGYTGAGVKIAILDPGFAGYNSLLGSELPSSVGTWCIEDVENPWPGTSVHGTACAEIIHDIAPDAQLYLVKAVTEVEVGSAVNYLIDQNVDIISFSAGWFIGGPGDGTGSICEIVEHAKSHGILWVNAMGNHAERHWQGNFSDSGSFVTDNEGNKYSLHKFKDGDIGNSLSVGAGDPVVIYLKWNDTWGASFNDYDLLLCRSSNGEIVAASGNTQNGDNSPNDYPNDYPIEYLSYVAPYSESYFIAIMEYHASSNKNFHLYSAYHELEYQTASSSLTIPADSSSAFSVGAVKYSDPTNLEYFSSQGPTKDGRKKPDLVAPDGVSTYSYGTNEFYGTSASAPHVAGVASLVKCRFPSYTPSQIQSYLETNAIPLGAAGKDNLYGSGRVNLPTPPPAAPSELTAIAVSTSLINLAWDDNSDNETGFKIERKTGSGSYSQIATVGANVESYSSTGLTINTSYSYRVRAYNSAGNSDYSNESSATTWPPAPPVPVLSSPASGSIAYRLIPRLEWNASTGASDYSLQIATDAVFSNIIINESLITVTYYDVISGLDWNHSYFWRVNAREIHGSTSNWSVTSTFTTAAGAPPNTPSGLAGTSISPRQINLTWQDNSADETGFVIERKTGEGNYSSIATVEANFTTLNDNTDLLGNTTYNYRIKSMNAVNYSDWIEAEPVTTLPYVPPTVITCEASDLGKTSAIVNGNIEDLGTAVSATVSFQYGETSGVYPAETDPQPIEIITAGESVKTQLLCVRSSQPSNVAELKPETGNIYIAVESQADLPWLYAALAFYGITEEEISIIVISESDINQAVIKGVTHAALITSHPSADLQTHITSGQLKLLPWSQDCITSMITTYPDKLISTYLPANTYQGQSVDMTGYSEIGGFSTELTNLYADTTYYFRAVAFGDIPAYGNEKSFITVAPDQPPSNPTGLIANLINVNRVELSWIEDSYLQSGFRIERSEALDFLDNNDFYAAKDEKSYADTTTTLDKTYYYRVFAYNIIDNSDPSEVVIVTIPGIPEVPTGLKATVISKSQINLSWTDNANDEANYLIERKTGTSGTYALVSTLGSNSTAYNDTGLSASTTYFYKIVATNIAGQTSSEEISAKTNSASTGSGGGGGGGGGGGPKIYTINTTGLTCSTALCVDKYGIVQNDVQVGSDNGNVSLKITKDTKMAYPSGLKLDKLTITKLAAPPAAPDKKTIVAAYEFGPEGAKFNPNLTLTLKYDPKALADGCKLELAYWDKTQWVGLDSQINDEAGTISTLVTHFSQYALLVEPPPPSAKFKISELKISADKVQIDEKVTIQADVTNVGNSQGPYSIVLKVNDQGVDKLEGSLDVGQSQTVSFEISRNTPGEYTLLIGDSAAMFTVLAPPSPTVESTPISHNFIPQSVPTVTPPVVQLSPPPSTTSPGPGVPLFLTLGLVIVALAVVIGVILYRRARG